MIQKIVNSAAFLLAWSGIGAFASYFGLPFADYLAWTFLVSGLFILLCLVFLCCLAWFMICKALLRSKR